MGACSFNEHIRIPRDATNEEAFRNAVSGTAHERGHGGYTGSLAEKNSFVFITRAKSRENANRIERALMETEPLPLYREEIIRLVDDKWGPAGAIRYPIDAKSDGMLFFGFASS